MLKPSMEQFIQGEDNRVVDANVKSKTLLGLCCLLGSDTPTQLPMYVLARDKPIDIYTVISGRLVTERLEIRPIYLELSDGYFDTALLASALGRRIPEGEGYALSISAQDTGLPIATLEALMAQES